MFPSNIAGLPTWYTIRANQHGYIGRKKEIDFLVAMNPETANEDVLSLEPGAAVLYDEPLKLSALRNDLVFYPVPFDKIVAEVCKDAKLRRLVKNMIYDGVLSSLLQHRPGADGARAAEAAGEEGQGRRAEHGRARGRVRLRREEPVQARSLLDRADGQDGRDDPGRRQRRRRARLHDGRRDRRRLVSDHAVVVAARDADWLHEEVPDRQGDGQGDLRDRPGRGRDRVDRDGRSAPGGRGRGR